jgi:hypothetical protein
LKKNSNSQTKSGQKTKPTKARGPVQRDSKEVMAELVAKLSERLEQKPGSNGREAKGRACAQSGPADGWGWTWETNGATTAFWGLEGRDAGGGTVADDARGCGGIVPGISGCARGHRCDHNPQLRFSRANRTTSASISGETRGRPE